MSRYLIEIGDEVLQTLGHEQYELIGEVQEKKTIELRAAYAMKNQALKDLRAANEKIDKLWKAETE